MELGICCHPNDVAGLHAAPIDFLEVNVQSFLVPEMEDSDFQLNLEAAQSAIKPVKSANCFLPGDLKCVGPDIDKERLMRYATSAFRRAGLVGIETVVFGSGGARTIPEDWSLEQALEEFSAFTRQIGPIAQRHGVTIVIEPLNRQECNFINTLEDGADIVERCSHPNVRLLADAYHMLKNDEPFSEIARFGQLISHVHLAEMQGRFYPGKSHEDFRPVFQTPRDASYDGRIALECAWDDLAADLPKSIQYLQEQMRG